MRSDQWSCPLPSAGLVALANPACSRRTWARENNMNELGFTFCNKPFIAVFSDHPRYTMRRADAIGLSFMRVHLKVDEVLVRVLLGCAN